MALFPLFSSPRGGGGGGGSGGGGGGDGRASPSAMLTANASAHGGGGDRSAPLGRWEFSQGFSVGRSRRCELKIPTTKDTLTVSKRHVGVAPMAESAAVTLRAAGGDWTFARRRWVLFDMEPMNGTAVNGVELGPGGTHELRDGDQIVLASAMRQCVQLSVHFPDRAYSSIAIKAVARSLAPPAGPSTTTAIATATATVTAAGTRAGPSAVNTADGISARAPSTTQPMELCRSPGRTEETPERPDATGRERSAAEAELSAPVSSKRSRRSTAPEDDAPARGSWLRRAGVRSPQPDGAAQQQRKRTRRGELAREAGTQETQEEAPTQTEARSDDRIARSGTAAAGPEQERERFMVCPVCLDFFHASATLPCSHTFCGQCISSWFRTSLSCPECRDVVRALPVRNRALDDLVQRLVGDSDAYKALIARRAQEQREAAARPVPLQTSASAGGGLFGALSPSRRGFRHSRSFPPGQQADVFARWSVDEKHAFAAFLSAQVGEARVAACRKVGLTERAIDSASAMELLVAAQNLLPDCSALRGAGVGVGDEGRQRLKIFLFYG